MLTITVVFYVPPGKPKVTNFYPDIQNRCMHRPWLSPHFRNEAVSAMLTHGPVTHTDATHFWRKYIRAFNRLNN